MTPRRIESGILLLFDIWPLFDKVISQVQGGHRVAGRGFFCRSSAFSVQRHYRNCSSKDSTEVWASYSSIHSSSARIAPHNFSVTKRALEMIPEGLLGLNER
ncbi:hypothetical protein M404DRAFT_998440 [Pisolithus tinctorius Marx 270]|uniref:Uncharacterized protein n=1 Tax=Pisolithus tinctorius Marx 270 TaxID=870435 RepID=A0A0C3KBI5_PISTI|nr:hypothetical protein M404DRAFT_998440 [Pisolithus tinctorius Marx 270]